jgi:hypothetical protein
MLKRWKRSGRKSSAFALILPPILEILFVNFLMIFKIIYRGVNFSKAVFTRKYSDADTF